MKKKFIKYIFGTLGVLAIVGGVVHAVQGAFDVSILSIVGDTLGRIVQAGVGIATVVFGVKYFMKK
jgi:hypothetical protein